MFLYVSQRKAYSKLILDALTKTGAFLMLSSPDTACFYCRKKETGGVILDCVTDPKITQNLCEQLRAMYPAIPIAAIVSGNTVPDLCADIVVRDTGEPSVLIEQLRVFLTKTCAWTAYSLSTYSLTVHSDPSLPAFYMGSPLNLSPKEHRLLYCLFYRAPRPTTVDDLLDLCYHGESCSLATFNTLIRRINRQAAEIYPPTLIIREGDYYRLRDGIL